RFVADLCCCFGNSTCRFRGIDRTLRSEVIEMASDSSGEAGLPVNAEVFGQDDWERRWTRALREHADVIATRPPNAHLLAATGDLPPGLALDAGCGHGAETLWLAAHGWRVTAVDFAASALDQARSSAEAIGTEVAERVDWVQGDLST